MYSSREVMKLGKVTMRQLQWWDEQKIVVPALYGGNRHYTAEQLVEVRVIGELRRRGVACQRIRKIWPGVHRKLEQLFSGHRLTREDAYLLTDGEVALVLFAADNILGVLERAKRPLLCLYLSDHVRRLRPPQSFRAA